MRVLVALVCMAGVLTACDQVRQIAAPQGDLRSSQQVGFDYRVADISRDVTEYRSLGTKSVSIRGTIEFASNDDTPNGNYLLIGKLRVEGPGDTNEQDIFVLVEHGRGEYQGVIYSDFDVPRSDPSPEIRADQIGFSLTGVIRLEPASLTRLADSVSRSNAAQTSPPEE